ncbi:MAG: TraV family lipoprotein [Desulfovibrio sp.]|nr:TraV family lipoprotein [Desulfovibrio sp.]
MLNGGYETDFTDCPRAETGECMSVEQAHLNAREKTFGGEYSRRGADRYGADEYEGAFPEGDDENSSQKPLEVLIAELKDCVREKDNKCMESREKEIEAYNRKIEDRAVARRQFKEDLEQRSMKSTLPANASRSWGEMPLRTEDRMMELVLLPYQTETGAMASARKYWFVIEEGQWGFDPLGKDAGKRTIGRLGHSAVSQE